MQSNLDQLEEIWGLWYIKSWIAWNTERVPNLCVVISVFERVIRDHLAYVVWYIDFYVKVLGHELQASAPFRSCG